METRRPGRPSKGDRKSAGPFMWPTPVVEAMKRQAGRCGMTATDFVGELVAAHLGMPYAPQEGLPLEQAS